MKERGIPFMGDMVRAVLTKIKKLTRRELSSQPPADSTVLVGVYHPTVVDRHGDEQPGPECYGAYSTNGEWSLKCPYGRPGDRLWVRENYRLDVGFNDLPPREVQDTASVWYEADVGLASLRGLAFQGKLRPGMFMCRWMSRILLEVVSVRIERLQDISEADCIAEGIYERPNAGSDPARWKVYGKEDTYTTDPVTSYQSLWEQINGAGSWDLNPWVWVVEFKKIEP